jgi:hypothetical protein
MARRLHLGAASTSEQPPVNIGAEANLGSIGLKHPGDRMATSQKADLPKI